MGLYLSFIIINTAVFLQMVGVGMIVARPASADHGSVGIGGECRLSCIRFCVVLCDVSDSYRHACRQVWNQALSCRLDICFVLWLGCCNYFSGSANMIFLGRMLQGVGEIPMWALGTCPADITGRRLAKGNPWGYTTRRCIAD